MKINGNKAVLNVGGTEHKVPLNPAQVNRIIKNEFLLRQEMIKLLAGNRRDINKECGYPDALNITHYKQAYDRGDIANRLVRVYPVETWAMLPDIYETEDLSQKTKFEEGLEYLEENFQLMSTLERADIQSGIGRFGIILLGLNDGQNLKERVPNIDEEGKRVEGKKDLELLFMRVFSEAHVEVKSLETDPRNRRFGQPKTYEIDLFNVEDSSVPKTDPSNLGSQTTKVAVHWSRVIHIADNRESSEVFGVPRLQHIYNRIWDIHKILGANGEGYWKGGFPGLSLETHPNIEGPEIDKEATKEEILKYMEGQQRYLALEGLHANSLTPQIADPNTHFETHIAAIAVATDIPVRVLLGSEEGKLASAQDSRRWNRRLMSRQTKYVTPYILRPVIQRFIDLGVLPKPEKMYIKWADLNAPAENDLALNATKITEALAKYVAGNVEVIMDPKTFLVHVCKFPIDLVEQNLKKVGDEIKKLKKMADLSANPPPKPTAGNPAARGSAKRTPKSKTTGAGPA